MKTSRYKFRYPNLATRLVKEFLSICTNFGMPIFSFIIISIAMAMCGVIKYLGIEMWMTLLGVAVVLGIILSIKYFCCYKGVILYDTYLEIATHTFGLARSKPKIKINYMDILSIYNSTYNLRYDRRKARNSFLVGDYSDYVELTLKGGKQFCFSVDNQTEFVDELLSRIESLSIE